jgi:hypothetical protein
MIGTRLSDFGAFADFGNPDIPPGIARGPLIGCVKLA